MRVFFLPHGIFTRSTKAAPGSTRSRYHILIIKLGEILDDFDVAICIVVVAPKWYNSDIGRLECDIWKKRVST